MTGLIVCGIAAGLALSNSILVIAGVTLVIACLGLLALLDPDSVLRGLARLNRGLSTMTGKPPASL
jgi:hypothetical protein